MTLLEVRNLKTYFSTYLGELKAVDGISFDVGRGEALGLAGESGCGKTTAALSIIKLVPPPGRIVEGKILFKGENIVEKNEKEMKKLRWKGISIVFQGSMNALNPVLRVDQQITEAIVAHESIDEIAARRKVKELFEQVNIDHLRAGNYPHEFSGGMKQRVMIAMALACNPDLIIADEPTTALDVMVQAQILKLIKELKEKMGLAMILISHDLSVISKISDKAAIMYAGKIVEGADIITLFKHAMHPYTQMLIDAFPHLKRDKALITIPGNPPNLINPPPGCRFHPRCKFANEICRKVEPELIDIEGKEHYVACHMVK